MLWKRLRFRAVGLLLSKPRGVYYGWPMLVGLSLAETVSWGILYYAFSVFVLPMERELGWSRSQVMGAFSLALLVSGLAAVPVGHWLDAHGARGLMTAGSAVAALLLLAWSRVDSLVGLYLVWAGLGVAMAAVLYEPAFAVVASWFIRHRDRAFTILTVFGGLASTIFVPLSSWLLERRGWRGAIAVLAAILACTTLPLHGLLLRRHPGEAPLPLERSVELRAALASGTFWSLTVAIVVSSLASVAAAVHLIPYLLESGVPAGTAGAAVGLMGAMQLPGRVLYAPMRRRIRPGWAPGAILLMQAAALAGLPWVSGRLGLVLFVAVFGMASGMTTLLRASALADAFGRSHYGRIGGVVAGLTTGARATGPIAAALAYTALGQYGPVFLGLAALLAVASAISLVSWRPVTAE